MRREHSWYPVVFMSANTALSAAVAYVTIGLVLSGAENDLRLLAAVINAFLFGIGSGFILGLTTESRGWIPPFSGLLLTTSVSVILATGLAAQFLQETEFGKGHVLWTSLWAILAFLAMFPVIDWRKRPNHNGV